MSVLVGIEMERAFSALAPLIRLPSPLGRAGIIRAFGAPPIGRRPRQLFEPILDLASPNSGSCRNRVLP